MAVSPTPEQIAALKPVERFNFRVIHALNSSSRIRRFLTVLGATFGKTWVELGTSRTVAHHGFENFKKIDPNRGVLLVVNHRTFYDQFAVSARLFRLYGAHHNIYFPVRANFFYDSPVALLVNIPFATGVMYPPIIRDKKRREWNRYAVELMADLLKDRRNMIGFHPEGTRNRGPDPNVIPVFLQGFPKSLLQLVRRNFSQKSSCEPMVHMVMGEPMDFPEEIKLEPSRKTFLQISQKVMQSIERLAAQERELRRQLQRQEVQRYEETRNGSF